MANDPGEVLLQTFYRIEGQSWEASRPERSVSRELAITGTQIVEDPASATWAAFCEQDRFADDEFGQKDLVDHWIECRAVRRHVMSLETLAAFTTQPPGSLLHRGSPIAKPVRWQLELSHERDELDRFATRAFNLLRWRHDAAFGPLELASELREMRWSQSATIEECLESPQGLVVPTPSVRVRLQLREIEASPHRRIQEIVGSGSEDVDCVGHDLLRHASRSALSSPVSGYVIGMAALEIGVKRCIAELQPASKFFLEREVAPPIWKLISQYLPGCPAKCLVRGRVVAPPAGSGIPKVINDAVRRRNELVHWSGGAPTEAQLDELFMAVKDVLYLMDFYRGFEWAWQHLRESTRRALEQEAERGGGALG